MSTEQANDILAGFDKAIAGFVHAAGGNTALAHYRKQRAEADARRAKLSEQVREQCLGAAKDCIEAARYPNSSSDEISSAIACLLKAREAAQELDPKEAA